MARRALFALMAITVVIIASMIRMSYKIERTKMAINRVVEEMQRCGRVELLGPKDDVILNMGQPVKQEVVQSVTGGLADRLYYQYSIKTDHLPYFDVDRHFQKVVAIDCAFSRHDLRTVIKKGQTQLPKEFALPTDRTRY